MDQYNETKYYVQYSSKCWKMKSRYFLYKLKRIRKLLERRIEVFELAAPLFE